MTQSKKGSSQDIQQLVGSFLSNGVSLISGVLQQSVSSVQREFGQKLFDAVELQNSLSNVIESITVLPLDAQVGFWMSALSLDRDWGPESSLIAPCLFALLQEAAKNKTTQSVSDPWWKNWKSLTLSVLKSKHAEPPSWARSMQEFLSKSPVLPLDVAEVVKVLDKTVLGVKKSKPSPKPKGSDRSSSVPLKRERDSLILATDQLISGLQQLETKWERECQTLHNKVAELEKGRAKLLQTHEALEHRLATLEKERDEYHRQCDHLQEELSGVKEQYRTVRSQITDVSVQRDQLQLEVSEWKQAAEMHEHRAMQVQEELTLEFHHRIRKKVLPLAGYLKNRVEEILHADLSNEAIQLLALEFDELHREVLCEANVPQDGRIDRALLSQFRGESHE